MIDHIVLAVADFAKSKAFYEKALAPLGYRLFKAFNAPGASRAAYTSDEIPDFWIVESRERIASVHVAFGAPDHVTVDAFYRAALLAGGKDNGPPGLRPQYHPYYYGAFIIDPAGHNIEAVCHRPQ